MEKNKESIRREGKHHLNRLFGWDVIDRDQSSIGKIENIWMDETGQPAFFGVKTGWLMGKICIVPAHHAEVSNKHQHIRVLHSEEKVKDAPSFDTSADLTAEQENEIYRYYNIQRAETHPERPIHTEEEPREPQARHTEDERTIQLNEEQVNVRKREVDTGGVRLRKVIRTETVNKPVELQHEDIEIERIPAEGAAPGQIEEEDIYIPLRQEEAVVDKETRAKEQIRVGKKTSTEKKDISDTVQKEDIEIDREDEEKRYGT